MEYIQVCFHRVTLSYRLGLTSARMQMAAIRPTTAIMCSSQLLFMCMLVLGPHMSTPSQHTKMVMAPNNRLRSAYPLVAYQVPVFQAMPMMIRLRGGAAAAACHGDTDDEGGKGSERVHTYMVAWHAYMDAIIHKCIDIWICAWIHKKRMIKEMGTVSACTCIGALHMHI